MALMRGVRWAVAGLAVMPWGARIASGVSDEHIPPSWGHWTEEILAGRGRYADRVQQCAGFEPGEYFTGSPPPLAPPPEILSEFNPPERPEGVEVGQPLTLDTWKPFVTGWVCKPAHGYQPSYLASRYKGFPVGSCPDDWVSVWPAHGAHSAAVWFGVRACGRAGVRKGGGGLSSTGCRGNY